jgi:flagellar FliL protein
VTAGSLLSLVTAYIVLAPDDLPKPFRLSYLYPTPTPEVTLEPTESPEEHLAKEIKPGEGVMIDTGTKIINLAETTGNKYIRINVVVEFAPAVLEEAAEEEAAVTELTTAVNARLPMINDTIITLLSSKSFEELYTATGKEALRGELIQKLQGMMPEFKIIGVYFTEFVVE